MTTAATILIAAATLGQLATHSSGTVSSVSDPDQWCVSRGYASAGSTISVASYFPDGTDVGNVAYRIANGQVIPARAYLVGDWLEFGAGGPGRVFAGQTPLPGGTAELLLIWDGIDTDPPRPSYADCRLAVDFAAADSRLVGDSTLDGVFDSSDLIAVFVAGQYEDDLHGYATWSTGDWNADGDFDTSDMIAAMVTGAYEQAVPAAAVPEPSHRLAWLLLAALPSFSQRRRRH